eukprot:1392344-Pleurochrysis_carterae.AAC.1
MRGEQSQSVIEVRVPRMESEIINKGEALGQSATVQALRDGDGRERKKAEELDGAGNLCAKGPEVTLDARRAGRLLETSALLPSIDERFDSATARLDFRSGHVFRHGAYCRFFTRGNLHRDLNLAAWRPAVLLTSCSVLRFLGSFSGFALSVYSGL